MNQISKRRFTLGMLAFVLPVVSQTAFAHQGGQANAGYVGDNRGHLVMDSAGKCVRTSQWMQELALAECDPDLMPKKAPKVEAPAPAPVAKAIPAPTVEKITLKAGALFDVGKADLKPAGKSELDDVATKLGTVKLEQITVTGHTDSTGAADFNQKLSEQRAASVKAYLTQKGIDAGRIVTVGKGGSAPAADNKTAAGRALNRRVELDIRAQQ